MSITHSDSNSSDLCIFLLVSSFALILSLKGTNLRFMVSKLNISIVEEAFFSTLYFSVSRKKSF